MEELYEGLVRSATSIVEAKAKLLTQLQAAVKAKALTASKYSAGLADNSFLIDGFCNLRERAGKIQDKQLAFCCSRVIRALQKYPLPIVHPEQMLQLQGVGKAMVRSVGKIFRDNAKHYKYLGQDKPQKKAKVAEKPIKKSKEIELPEDLMHKKLCDLRGTLSYEVSLLVDSREVFTAEIPQELPFEQRSLSIGDYMWIVRIKGRHEGEAPKEFAYDCLVERKTVEDLMSSHFSTHLSDQIARMQQSGIKLCWLIVEGSMSPKVRAVVNEVEFSYDLRIVETASQQHTLKWLALLSREVKLKTSQLTLSAVSALISFQGFQSLNKPSTKPGDIFMQQLLSIEGITSKKATLLLRSFESLKQLWREAAEDGDEFKAKLRWCGLSENLQRRLSLALVQP